MKATITPNTNIEGRTAKTSASTKADTGRFSTFLKKAQRPSVSVSGIEPHAAPVPKQRKISPHDSPQNIGRAEPRVLDMVFEPKVLKLETEHEDNAKDRKTKSKAFSLEPSVPSAELAASLAQLSTQASGQVHEHGHAFGQEKGTGAEHKSEDGSALPSEVGGFELLREAVEAPTGPHKTDKPANRGAVLNTSDLTCRTDETTPQGKEPHQPDAVWNKIVKDVPGPGEKQAASPKAVTAAATASNASEALIPFGAQHQAPDAGPSTNTSTLIDTIAGNSLLRERLPAPSARLSSHATSGGGVVEVLKLRLHPVELGHMEVAIRKKASAVSIQIRVDNIDAVASLSADLGAIQAGLKSLGYQVDAVVIEQASQGGAETSAQQNGGSQTNGNRQSNNSDRRLAEFSPSQAFVALGTGDEQTSHSVPRGYII